MCFFEIEGLTFCHSMLYSASLLGRAKQDFVSRYRLKKMLGYRNKMVTKLAAKMAGHFFYPDNGVVPVRNEGLDL